MDKLQQIKSLSSELSENALFNYSKRGILILMELFSWITFLTLFIIGIWITTYTPSYNFDESNEIKWENNEINNFCNSMGLICILLSFLIVVVAFFIRRTRRKKVQVYQLTQMIKSL